MEEFIVKWHEVILPWLLSHGLRILIILTGAFILQKIIRKFINRAVRLALVSDESMTSESRMRREQTLNRIFTATLRITILVLATLMVLQEIGVNIAPILAGAGIVGLALGFGGQYLIRDVITGLFLIIENQYRIGDVVNIDGTGGLVEDVSLRKTTLRDLDGTVHHISHGDIKKVSNLSKTFARVNLDVGVAYNSDMEQVIEVVNRVGNELAEDPVYKEFITQPPQFLRVNSLGDSSVVIKILGETKPLKQWEIMGELRKRILIAFRNENIEIPFPQRVIHSPAGKN
jgi:moderate conductance mechanosensitive channel